MASAAFALVLGACGGAPPARAPAPPRRVASPPPESPPVVTEAAPPPAEHWYLEHVAKSGRHALLRRLDASGRNTLQTRIVDVDTGDVLEEVTMPELGKFPGATIGMSASDLARLDAMLASPRFTDDLVRGAHVAKRFPAGACGRLSAGVGNAGIAFNAGDWLYLADNAGHVKRKLAQEAAYDPRFSPDGKYLFFRRATGVIDRVFARYELFVMPADLSQPPRALPGTAGVRERFDVSADGQSAVVVASHEPAVRTCVLSVGLRPPFAVKKLGCLEGSERLVETVVSPSGRWAAFTTQTPPDKDGAGPLGPLGPLGLAGPRGEEATKAKRAPRPLSWRLRVLALNGATSGQVVHDGVAEPGYSLRALSDGGTLVQSGLRGVRVDDVTQKTRRDARTPPDLGYRAFFRSDDELVVLRGASVAVVDVRAIE
jgi:hypothetical protein